MANRTEVLPKLRSPEYALQNVLNCRDVGKTVNSFLTKKIVREGVFFRSARPDDATPGDRALIRDVLGVRTIVDLRSDTELLNATRKRQAEQSNPRLWEANPALAEPLQLPGVQYVKVSITGRSFERHLLRQLSWWDFARVLFLYVFGFRMLAASLLGRKVLAPRGLVRLGLDTLDASKEDINAALTSLLRPGGLPLLVHCTQGKDRTGLIVLLVLMILGVPLHAIEFDYRSSDEALLPERERRMAEIKEIGLTEEFGLTAPSLVRKIHDHLEERYGGLECYLDAAGFDMTKVESLRNALAF